MGWSFFGRRSSGPVSSRSHRVREKEISIKSRGQRDDCIRNRGRARVTRKTTHRRLNGTERRKKLTHAHNPAAHTDKPRRRGVKKPIVRSKRARRGERDETKGRRRGGGEDSSLSTRAHLVGERFLVAEVMGKRYEEGGYHDRCLRRSGGENRIVNAMKS